MEFSSWAVLLLIICSVIGIGCFWIVLNDRIKHYSNQIDVVGRIVDFKRKDRKRYNSYVAVMEYSIDNKTYQNEADFIQLSEEEMLKFDSFDKEKVQEIESRYSIETRFLLEFENSDKIAFSINFEKPILELLLNLQKRLYIIAVYKIIKMQGKEVPNDIVTVDFSRLLEFIK